MKQIVCDVTYLPAIHQNQSCTRCFQHVASIRPSVYTVQQLCLFQQLSPSFVTLGLALKDL